MNDGESRVGVRHRHNNPCNWALARARWPAVAGWKRPWAADGGDGLRPIGDHLQIAPADMTPL
jgi:hypothetical protein